MVKLYLVYLHSILRFAIIYLELYKRHKDVFYILINKEIKTLSISAAQNQLGHLPHHNWSNPTLGLLTYGHKKSRSLADATLKSVLTDIVKINIPQFAEAQLRFKIMKLLQEIKVSCIIGSRYNIEL